MACGSLERVAFHRVVTHPCGQLDEAATAAGEVDVAGSFKAFQDVQIVGQPPIGVALVGGAVCRTFRLKLMPVSPSSSLRVASMLLW